MSKTHWKKLHNPDYLGAYSLDNGSGYSDVVATISKVRQEQVVGADGKKDDCTVAYFKESLKPMILNATNLKSLEKLLKTPYIEDWNGRQIQIGVERIKAFGEVVDALRVRSFIPRTAEAAKCADCGTEVMATDRLTAPQMAAYGIKKYGKALCEPCMRKTMEAQPPQTENSEEIQNDGEKQNKSTKQQRNNTD